MENNSDCYKCVHRLNVPGSTHSRCNNFQARATGHEHGIKNGWFLWPFNFDPTWLTSCNGFSDNPEDKKDRQEASPVLELLMLLR